MQIKMAKQTGYCWGVDLAMEMVDKALAESAPPVYSLGPIIHNPLTIRSLEAKGLGVADSVDSVESGTVIIRTHGVPPEVAEKAEAKGLSVIDATCPFVKRSQKKAKSLVDEGYSLIVIGESTHPEVIAILGHAGGGEVVGTEEEVAQLPPRRRVGVVVQSTRNPGPTKRLIGEICEKFSEVKVFMSICNVTYHRQQEAEELAKECDVMLVVGGRNSANTKKLAMVCEEQHTQTYLVETAEELDPAWFEGVKSVGVVTGASTPHVVVDEVYRRLMTLATE
ncbi:MAG TPA: 4-hydroxy-3-methylbut-2-enyl diphosphate reductase [bacterium]|nr:4-hydroxy-3-methylbut-2-enyl diphosphate reductase [bacterium]